MYKKVLFIILLALLLIDSYKLIIKASEDTTSNQQIIDTTFGLSMKITSDRKKYQPYQPIYIRITITNNTPNEVIFNKRFAITKRKEAGFKSEIGFKVVKPDGKDAGVEFVSDVDPLAESDFVKIKPKTKYERILEITRWYWKELGTSGLYTLKCTYFNDMTGYQRQGADGYELMEMYAWIGELESNMVTFVIDEITRDGINSLTSRLSDETIYWGERSKIAEILGDLKNGWALDSLLGRLKTGEHEVVRNKCIEAILKYGNFSEKRLLKLLDNTDFMTKVLASKVLCLIGNNKGMGIVRKEIASKDWQIVIEAMRALQCMDKDIAIKDITVADLVNSKEEAVSYTAIEILKELGRKVDFNKTTNKWEIGK